MELFKLAIIVCVASLFLYSLIRGIWLTVKKKNGEGFLYLFVSSIIGILVYIAIPQFKHYNHCTTGRIKADLTNSYLECYAYWEDSGSDKQCSPDILRNQNYKFYLYSDKSCDFDDAYELKASGNKETYKATGSIFHNGNIVALYELDATGNIQEKISPYYKGER